MSQSLAETHVENLIYECDCITAGEYGESTQEHIDDLMLQMEGFSFPLMCTRSSSIPRDKTLKGVKRAKGWLVANMAALTNSGNGTTVSSSSVSQATATADVSVEVSQAVAEIGNDPVLDNETKEALELALSRARMAAEAKNKTGFAEHVAKSSTLRRRAWISYPRLCWPSVRSRSSSAPRKPPSTRQEPTRRCPGTFRH